MDISRRKKAAACLIFTSLLEEESEQRSWKRGRTRQWIRRRETSGMFVLVKELRAEDTAAYGEMLRMN